MDLFNERNYNIDVDKNIPQIVYGPPPSFIEEDRNLFRACEGGYMGPNLLYTIEKDDDRFLFKTYYESMNMETVVDDVIEKEEKDYNEFISILKKETSDWNLEYDNWDILDGTQWEIFLLEENRRYRGSNAFPESYDKVMGIIKSFFSAIPKEYSLPFEEEGENLDLNNKKYDINPADNIPQKVYGVPRNLLNFEMKRLIIQLKNKESYYIFSFSLTDEDKMEFLLLDGNDSDSLELKGKVIDKRYYRNLLSRYTNITKDWQESYIGDKDINWIIKEITDVTKVRSGIGEVPENWSSFINLLMEYEELYNKAGE